MSGEDDSPSPKGFADLIGETKPVRGQDKQRMAPPRPAEAKLRARPGQTSPGQDSGASEHSDRFRRPDASEPRLAARSGVSDKQLRALARGEPAPEERIDLHGLRAEGGDRILAARLASARQRGLVCVAVIHGRGQNSPTGEAVLRDQLPRWLQSSPAAKSVLAFAPAPPKLGGSGATLVLLRRPR